MLGKAKAKGILVLSGDRYSAEISKLEGVLSLPLFDVTLSAMNQKQRPQSVENPNRTGERYFKENFGLLKINWSKPKPLVTMGIRDLGGKVVQVVQVTF